MIKNNNAILLKDVGDATLHRVLFFICELRFVFVGKIVVSGCVFYSFEFNVLRLLDLSLNVRDSLCYLAHSWGKR